METDPRAMDLRDDSAPEGAAESSLVASRGGSTVNYNHEDTTLGLLAVSPKIERLIDLALRGALPRSRALKAWESDKLNSRHIGCVLLRAAGYRQNRISELMGYSQATLSVILNHPDSKTILAAILAEGAKQAIDISSTIQAHAPAMLTIVQDIADDPEAKPETRLKAAFGWLGMYERDQENKSGRGEDSSVKMASEDAQRLADAIRESAGLLSVPSDVVARRESGGSGAASPEPGPAIGSLNLPSDATSLELTPEQIKQVMDERAAELEAELEQRLQVLELPKEEVA